MMLAGLALVLVSAALGALPLILALRLRRYVRRALAAPLPSHAPRVSVILPCKGVEKEFEENFRSLLRQDYPGYEVVVAVATADDPALAVVRRLAAAASVPVSLVVAGLSAERSQKINNQLAALKRVDEHAEVLVFIDSDARLSPDFLRRLVGPLEQPGVGMTTGYRWYDPPRGRWADLLRSTWNGGALPMLIDQRHAFAFGGSMAIRREVFAQAGGAEVWRRAATDDFPLAGAVRRLGLDVRFVPQCLVTSHDEMTLRQVVEWTNRQTIICRVYRPALWWTITLAHAVSNAVALAGVGAVAAAAAGGPAWLWWGAALLVPLAAQMADALLLLPLVARMVPQTAAALRRRRWAYVLLTPLASLLILVNTLHSLLTRRIRWRGVTYRLVSPVETVVVEGGS
jgi:ceramide glucosyltransferase